MSLCASSSSSFSSSPSSIIEHPRVAPNQHFPPQKSIQKFDWTLYLVLDALVPAPNFETAAHKHVKLLTNFHAQHLLLLLEMPDCVDMNWLHLPCLLPLLPPFLSLLSSSIKSCAQIITRSRWLMGGFPLPWVGRWRRSLFSTGTWARSPEREREREWRTWYALWWPWPCSRRWRCCWCTLVFL